MFLRQATSVVGSEIHTRSKVNRATADGGSTRQGNLATLERRRSAALFLSFVGFYLLTLGGHFYNVDEENLYLVTESLVERHSVALPRGAWGTAWPLSTVEQVAADAPIYSTFAPGQSFAALPFYLAAKGLAAFFPAEALPYLSRAVVSSLNAFVTAATVVVLYWLARVLGYRGAPALGLAVTYGVATFAWPHGRTFLAEPLTALLLLASFAALCRATLSSEIERWSMLGGMAVMAAIATKPHALLALPVLTCYLVAHTVLRQPRRLPSLVQPLLFWVIGILLIALPYGLYNTRFYGQPFATGYTSVGWSLLTTPFLTGLIGLTISSGKGLLWFAPPILLAVAGWWRFALANRLEALTCLGLTLVHLVFYSLVRFWHGDWSWGPRFLLLTLPFALLPLVALYANLPVQQGWRLLILGVVSAGIVVQLLGSFVNFGWAIIREDDEMVRWFDPGHAPLLMHGQQLVSRWQEWWWQARPSDSTAMLIAGFAAPESAQHAQVFPRWTTGSGQVAVFGDHRSPLTVTLTYVDPRPAALRPTQVTIAINGEPLPASAIDRSSLAADGSGWRYAFPIPAAQLRNRQAMVTIESATWNPKVAGVANRDETLGIFVQDISVSDGERQYRVVQMRTIPPAPVQSERLYHWFNDDRAADSPAVDAPAHHLVDWWGWYGSHAGFPRQPAFFVALIVGGLSSGMMILGLLLGRTTLPQRVSPRPRAFRRYRRKERGANSRA